METIETARARHAAELLKLEAKHALAAACPVPPKRTQCNSSGIADWIVYEVTSLVDALHLLGRLGDVVPFYRYKGTFTRLQPEALADSKSGEIVAGPFAVSLASSQGRGFGPDATLKAFFTVGGRVVQAHIDIRNAHPFSSTPVYENERAAYRDDARIREWRSNTDLNAMSDNYIKWGSGSTDSCSFEYMWMADSEEGGRDHATAMLDNLAGTIRKRSLSDMAQAFLGVLLEDLQMSENEEATMEEREPRDCGTIWTAPESTVSYAIEACRNFESAIRRDDELVTAVEMASDQAGSDLYMEMAGHGVGFADRECWNADRDTNASIAERLSALVKSSSLETYIGDDSRAYVVGGEKHGERY